MRRSSRIKKQEEEVAKAKEAEKEAEEEEEEDEPKTAKRGRPRKSAAATTPTRKRTRRGSSSGAEPAEEEEEMEEEETPKRGRGRTRKASTPAKKKATTPRKKAPATRGRKRKAAEEDVEEEEEAEDHKDEAEEEEEEAPTGPVRRSKRIRAQAASPAKKTEEDEEEEEEEGEEGEEEDGADGGEFDENEGETQLTWGAQRRLQKRMQRAARWEKRQPPKLVRSGSYSANDILNASYRDLFGLGAVARPMLPPAPPRRLTAPNSDASEDGSQDRWVLLHHHHWLLRQINEDGRVRVQDNLNNFHYGQMALEEIADEPENGEESQPNVYSDNEGTLPLYFYPPADGSSCFDELPTETLMHIFSFFNAATMAQGMSVCKTWKELLSDSYFWRRQYLVVEPLILKPYNNYTWNQYVGYAVRFIKDEPVVGRSNPITDARDLSTYQNYNRPYVDPNPQDYEFDEVWHVDPVTGCGQYMLSRNDKYIDKKFGLGLLVFAGGWTGHMSFKSDAWWLEHYSIGSRREEELLRPDGAYKSLCNPKLWRWRLLHSDGKDEVTGVVLFNIGYLETLVAEGRWQSELSKLDLQFLYQVMNDAAIQMDFRVFEQQTIPAWLQFHKKAERQRRIEARRALRESQEKGKEKLTAEELPASMDIDVESQASQQEDTVAAVDEKPFRHTKPEGIVSKLYSYQLESLTWMTEIEDRVSRGMYWETIRLTSFPDNVCTHIVMHPDGTDLCTYDQLDKHKHYLRIYTRGGILAEEMGLGKTLIILALIAIQRQNADKIIARDEALYPLTDGLFRTKATLVLCPSHLAQQWAGEVAKHTNPPLKVLVITTIVQHRQYTYKDIIDADLVVVSFSFLVNKNYEGVRAGCKPSALGDDDPKLARTHSPLLSQFRWLRMVLDEAHELPFGRGRKGKTGIDDISPLQATFRWYITGSPFPHGRQSLFNALDLLRLKVKKPIDPNHVGSKTQQEKNEEEGFTIPQLRYGGHTWLSNVEREVMKNLYCRHTKQSVSNEYTLPGVTNQVVLLRHTIIERALYEVAKIENRDDEMRQICCHPQLSNTYYRMAMKEKNLWEIFTETIAQKKQQIKTTSTSLKSTRDLLQTHENSLRHLKDDWKRQRAWMANWKPTKGEQERKLGLKNTIRKEKKEISSLEASLEMYEKSLAHLEEVEAKYHITKQGKRKAKGKPYDPLLEEQDSKEGLAILEAATKDLPSATFSLPDSVSEDMVAVHGSKMPHLLVYVQQLCESEDSRIIIFSQWTRLLVLIGNLLEEHGVRTIFCRGNVYQRNKAIAAFQKSVNTQPKKVVKGKEPEPLPRVLMLSLENAASGTNLTQATHIILVDPICGSRSRAHAIEAQAIGRAHRLGQTQKLTVVRFLVVNTIEHDTYLRNYVNKDDDDDEEEPAPVSENKSKDSSAAQAKGDVATY